MVVAKMSQVNQTDLPPGRARMQQQKGPCVLSAMENFFTLKATLSYPHKPLTPLGRITPQTFHGKNDFIYLIPHQTWCNCATNVLLVAKFAKDSRTG